MSFLQPWLLWALPLVLLPVLIHLMNRMRYRTRSWAAMSFLLAASRRSRRHAKLRHWLILLFRALGIAALLLAIARPLAGGWLGWALQSTPDTVILLLDRSVSMETRDPTAAETKRQRALQRFSEAIGDSSGTTRYFLIDSATRTPREVTGLGDLAELTAAAPTDTAADIPALLTAGVDTILANQAGRSEIWLASDLQRSNWFPDSPRWTELMEQLAALPQGITVRLLALTAAPSGNAAVEIAAAHRSSHGGRSVLDLTVDLKRAGSAPTRFPLLLNLEGVRTPIEVEMTGQQLRLQRRIEVHDHPGAGWGSLELPADANLRDNRAYFVFESEQALRALVVSDDDRLAALLRLAVAPAPELMRHSATRLRREEFDSAALDDVALIIWQGLESGTPARRRLDAFASEGGVVMQFPARDAAVDTAPDGEPFRVTVWDDREGLLARTNDGIALPVNETSILKRQLLPAADQIVASFSDGQPFLIRRPQAAGAIYTCATLPDGEWSNLAESLVLVPMLQRALQEGSRRLGTTTTTICGDESLPAEPDLWQREDVAEARLQPGWFEAGIYRSGSRWLALNRPPAEDDPDQLEEAAVRPLFGEVTMRFFEDTSTTGNQRLQSEIWRLFLWAMLLFLLAETLLALPGRPAIRTAEGTTWAA